MMYLKVFSDLTIKLRYPRLPIKEMLYIEGMEVKLILQNIGGL